MNEDYQKYSSLAPFTLFLGKTGYGLMDSGVALYNLATDAPTQDRALNGISYAINHPAAVVDAAGTGIQNFLNKPFGAQADSVFEFAVGGLATAGAPTVIGATGRGVSATAEWLAPEFGAMMENYLYKTGGLTYAMPPQLKAGMVFEDAGVAKASGEAFQQDLAARRVSIRAIGDDGNLLDGRTVLDVVGTRFDTGTLGGLEFKNSESASLTLRQSEHFPFLMKNGGVIVGENGVKINLPAGTRVGPLDINRINGPTLPGANDWFKGANDWLKK